MANEAVLVYEDSLPWPMTCADGTGIEKGAILKMTDPNTCALADGSEDIFAGIAAEEKIANDGKTKIGVYKSGIFRVLAGGAISVGEALKTGAGAATNEVIIAATNDQNIIGYSLETADDTHTFLMQLKPTRMELA